MYYRAGLLGNLGGTFSIGAITIPLAWSATSSGITNEDVRVYKQGNLGSLPSDLGKAMQKACENLVETSVPQKGHSRRTSGPNTILHRGHSLSSPVTLRLQPGQENSRGRFLFMGP